MELNQQQEWNVEIKKLFLNNQQVKEKKPQDKKENISRWMKHKSKLVT